MNKTIEKILEFFSLIIRFVLEFFTPPRCFIRVGYYKQYVYAIIMRYWGVLVKSFNKWHKNRGTIFGGFRKTL